MSYTPIQSIIGKYIYNLGRGLNFPGHFSSLKSFGYFSS